MVTGTGTKRQSASALAMPRTPLSIPLILLWVDRFHRRTRRWPSCYSGRVAWVRGENWRSVDNALRHGLRGLTGGSSLARLLEAERGVRNRLNPPPLNIQRIL